MISKNLHTNLPANYHLLAINSTQPPLVKITATEHSVLHHELPNLIDQLRCENIHSTTILGLEKPNNNIERIIIFNKMFHLINSENNKVEFKLEQELSEIGMSSLLSFKLDNSSIFIVPLYPIEVEVINTLKDRLMINASGVILGTLTEAAITTTYQQLKEKRYAGNKLHFKYSSEKLTLKEKMLEEDHYAQFILSSESHNGVVIKFAAKLASYLAKPNTIFSGADFDNFFFSQAIIDLRAFYPIHKLASSLTTKDELINFLNTTTDTLALLWIIRYLPKRLAVKNNPPLSMCIDYIYKNRIQANRDHFVDNEKGTIKNETFGNSRMVSSDSFNHKDFFPFARAIDYIEINPKTTKAKVRKYIDGQIPYISGPSGMANSGSTIFKLLEEDISAADSRSLIESMAAFIVGSGMHSYKEVYGAFNLTIKLA